MTKLHEGLTKKAASSSDSSTKWKESPTVNANATRGSTPAPTPKTLGPRTA